MTFDFDAVFNPTPEQKKRRQKILKDIRKQMIKGKCCDYCVNARFTTHYEHGMESGADCYCCITGKLRLWPQHNGKRCENWELRKEEGNA